jgi:2-methylcitrate dehydratase
MTLVEELASFVVKADYADLSEQARLQLKIHILDALGCAIGALQGEPVKLVRAHIQDFGGSHYCTLIGGGRSDPDRAAFYNSTLVRYLDFNDAYLAPGETCHPSDNLGPVLAACEYSGCRGRDLLAALAVAYQVQCRLSDEAPVRDKGFDHTTQGAYAAAAGVARALGLDVEKTANAIAISGTSYNSLRVTRTGRLSNWKGLASPNTMFGATHAAFLALRGVTGPLEVFEGNKGFMDAIAGKFSINWQQEDLESITRTIIKRFNAEIHSQSALEATLDLRRQYEFQVDQIREILCEIFDVAYNIIGGGEEGNKTLVHTKEEADHSLPYMIAVALLDGKVMPEEYLPERIQSPDVQSLLHKVLVRPNPAFSQRFPAEMPCRLTIQLNDGRLLETEKQGYEGFVTDPMRWETLYQKFERLSLPFTDTTLRHEIADAVANLESISVRDLTRLLEQVKLPPETG